MNAPADLSQLARAALPDWPRLMSVELAAAYLSIGTTTLRTRGPKPRHIGTRVLYDRHDLDRFADALAGQPLDAGRREAEGSEIAARAAERMARNRPRGR